MTGRQVSTSPAGRHVSPAGRSTASSPSTLRRGSLEGALAFDRLSLGGLASLAVGTLQSPLPGNLWPAGRFGGVMSPPFETT